MIINAIGPMSERTRFTTFLFMFSPSLLIRSNRVDIVTLKDWEGPTKVSYSIPFYLDMSPNVNLIEKLVTTR